MSQPAFAETCPDPTTDELDALAQNALRLGHEVVEISGTLDEIDEDARSQANAMATLKAGAKAILDANRGVEETALGVKARAESSKASLKDSEAVAAGKIDEAILFNASYTPIPGSNPEQVMAPFTLLTDTLFAPIQEATAGFDEKVVFLRGRRSQRIPANSQSQILSTTGTRSGVEFFQLSKPADVR